MGVVREKALLLLWCCVCYYPCLFTPQGLSYQNQLLIVTRFGFICTHICNKVAQLQIHQTPFQSLIIGCSWFLHARILGNPSYIFKYTPSFFFRQYTRTQLLPLVRLPGHSSGGKPRHCGREPTQHSAPTGFQTLSPKSLFSEGSLNLKG